MCGFFYVITFIIGLAGAWLIARYGSSLKLLDVANHRSSHSGNIPKGGGVGVLFAFVIACIILDLPAFFCLPAIMVALISLINDRQELSAKLRLAVHVICAFILVVSCKDEQSINLFLLFFFVLFIAGTANIYNFMDGINGIAGITAIISFAFLGVYLYLGDASFSYIALCIVMITSSLGFLFFNLPKASVFLGDVGSILIGFIFSSMVVLLSESLIDFMTMAGFLGLFYFDEFITMITRIFNGNSLIKPHRKHIYQLLVNEIKIDHWKVSLTYGLIQIIISICIILASKKGIFTLSGLYLIYIVLLFFISNAVQKAAAKC